MKEFEPPGDIDGAPPPPFGSGSEKCTLKIPSNPEMYSTETFTGQ